MENSILNIQNLLGYVLGKWRKVIIVALVFAFTLGAYGLYLNATNTESIVVKYEENADYYEELRAYTKDKSDIEGEIAVAQNKIDLKEDYINKSILMGLDSRNLAYGVIDIYLSTDSNESTEDIANILEMYMDAIPESTMFEDINVALGYNTDLQYIRELVSYWADSTAGIVTVRFYTNDEKETEKIGTEIVKVLEKINSEISTEVAHGFSLEDPKISHYADDAMSATQQKKRSELDALYADLDVVKQQLDSLVEPSKEYEVEEATTKSALKVNVPLYAAIGAVLGGGFMLFAISLVVICSNKIQDGKYISEEHGIYIYGKRPQFPDTKNPIDKMINKMTNKTSYNNEGEFYDYIATSINLLNNKKKSIHLIGTIEEKELVLVFEKLKEKVDVIITCGGNITENSDSLKKLMDADQVILVEALFKTTDEKLAKEVKLIRELQKEIIGAIIL